MRKINKFISSLTDEERNRLYVTLALANNQCSDNQTAFSQALKDEKHSGLERLLYISMQYGPAYFMTSESSAN